MKDSSFYIHVSVVLLCRLSYLYVEQGGSWSQQLCCNVRTHAPTQLRGWRWVVTGTS